MIYKVLYQDALDLAPVRESTKSLYIEATSERDVRNKLADHQYNIEFIQALEGKHLAYEQQSEDFKLVSTDE